jgi:hypothetical protein
MSNTTTLLPFRPSSMTPASWRPCPTWPRYSGQTHSMYAYQLRRWFGWRDTNGGLDRSRGSACNHGALAYLLGNNALRAYEAAAVRVEDYQ